MSDEWQTVEGKLPPEKELINPCKSIVLRSRRKRTTESNSIQGLAYSTFYDIRTPRSASDVPMSENVECNALQSAARPNPIVPYLLSHFQILAMVQRVK